MAIAWAVLMFWLRHRADFAWRSLWSLEFALIVAVALPLFGWWGGRRWARRYHDEMRSKYGWRPPAD